MDHPKTELSAEQEAVRRATEGQLVVAAAAGAGKTRVLVERYLKHVEEDGYRPDQILTVTFTRKAAAEMKKRIVVALREKGLAEAAQIAETGPIQTIHGFCERVLRENAFLAGLDPEFEVLSEAQTGRLVDRAIKEALALPLDDLPHARALIHDLAGRPTGREGRSPQEALEAAIARTVQELRGAADPDRLEEMYASPEGLVRTWHATILESVPPELSAPLEGGPEDFEASLRGRFREARRGTPGFMKGQLNWEEDVRCAEQACGLVALALEAWRRIESTMAITQRLDFAALEARAVSLVGNSAAVRARLASAFRIVMVDEAQDVNPLQHRLIESIAAPAQMTVGDAQQSIYGFRQADVELFRRKSETTKTLLLSTNYRSSKGILSFVDTLFGRLWPENYMPMMPTSETDLDTDHFAFEGVELWRNKDRDVHAVAGWIQELHREGEPLKDIAVLVRDGRYGLQLLSALQLEGVEARLAGGSERFYARLEVRDLANCLRSLADPYDDFSLLATLRSPFAGLSLDSIALLAKDTPVIERLSEFQPPLVEDREKLDRFLGWHEGVRRHADRLPAWETLSHVLAQSGYLEALAARRGGDRMLANVRKLLALAAQEVEMGPLEYAETIRETQAIRHKEGDAPAIDEKADVVTILTIHKAKGLEWPVVVVPQTDAPIGAKGADVEIDPRLGLVAPKFGARPSLFYRWLLERRRQREHEEELRILYVALTRAKRRLCICVHPQARERSLARLIANRMGYSEEPPPGTTVRGPAAADQPDGPVALRVVRGPLGGL